MAVFSVLFVCKANLCRSPSAHGVLRQKIREQGLEHGVVVDSAATHDYYPDHPPDPRSQAHAARRGYDLSDLRARAIRPEDFEQADLILVMDADNLRMVLERCPPAHSAKVKRLTEFCLTHASDVVPDPYEGKHQDFEHVLDLVEDACEGLLLQLRAAQTAAAPDAAQPLRARS